MFTPKWRATSGKIYVDVGDHVKTGQVLAILEVPELSGSGRRSQGRHTALSGRRSAVPTARSSARNRPTRLITRPTARLKAGLRVPPGTDRRAGTGRLPGQGQETQAQTESARAALAESESQLVAAQADLDRLSALEAYSHITAPFAGVVTKRYADTGASDSGRHHLRYTVHASRATGGVVEVAAGGPSAGIRSAATASGQRSAGACVGHEPRFRRDASPALRML